MGEVEMSPRKLTIEVVLRPYGSFGGGNGADYITRQMPLTALGEISGLDVLSITPGVTGEELNK